jgi:hypothetical protein
MASAIEPNPSSIDSCNHWRLPGVDFDLDGRESTLKELLGIGGFFPLATIKDRLPFSEQTIRRWAETKRDALSESIVPVRGRMGKCILILVHLNRLDEFIGAQVNARAARVAAQRSGRAGDSAGFTCSGVAG